MNMGLFRNRGIRFINDGLVMSIEDMFTENNMTYVATDYNTLVKRGDISLKSSTTSVIIPTTASSLIRDLKSDADFAAFERKMGVRGRDPYL